LQLEHDPDSGEVIICDLTMPDIDGIEFLQTLNASPFRGSVILLSGQSERVMHSVQRVLGGRQLTILGALTKPVDRDALRQRARLLVEGLDLRISVNISMASLMAPDYWRRLTTLVREAGAAPRDLVLEVTESQLPHSSLIPLENLVRLRLRHFTLSIDDFGTGHSSLAQLRDVPFTELKVDCGFVHGARDSQVIRPMLEGSIGIARRMGLRSVAEGVETMADWGLLRELGCELAQGYFIGRPMSAEQVLVWHSSWQARIPDLIRL
jgi:EAL domain-containing protein (putative c-di-GMP-specific phosphodiesterase class I)